MSRKYNDNDLFAPHTYKFSFFHNTFSRYLHYGLMDGVGGGGELKIGSKSQEP